MLRFSTLRKWTRNRTHVKLKSRSIRNRIRSAEIRKCSTVIDGTDERECVCVLEETTYIVAIQG